MSSPTKPQPVPVSATAVTHCVHRRVVDDVRTDSGEKTGLLICKECLAIFPDPTAPAAGEWPPAPDSPPAIPRPV